MKFLKSQKGKICAVIVLLAALFAVGFFGFADRKNEPLPSEDTEISAVAETEETEENQEIAQDNENVEEQKEENEEPSPEVSVDAEEKTELYCTLSVRCDTILANISQFDSEKLDILPQNGVIFSERKVEFEEGESVFDLLLREMKANKIHLEFVNTPVYGSVYIEGIANIYEFDAGELSGWMYRVNGEFPNYGCSKYILKQGDKVEFVYTCDLGKDVGGEYVK